LRFEFKASNNQAEYEALLAGMRLALEVGVKELEAKSDSQLVFGQVTGNFQTKDPQLLMYLERVRHLTQKFVSFKLLHVPREQTVEQICWLSWLALSDQEIIDQ
jgi:ribonuclease HI